jgi:hypothetical protein
MEVRWIEYNGKKILFSNYEGCKTSEEMINILYKEVEILEKQENKILVIANYNNSFGSTEYMGILKELGKTILSKKIEKTATMGIDGFKEALFKSYIFFSGQKNVKLFYDKESALNWLTED